MHGKENRKKDYFKRRRGSWLDCLFSGCGGISTLSLLYILLLPVFSCTRIHDNVFVTDEDMSEDVQLEESEYLVNLSIDNRISMQGVDGRIRIGLFVYEAEGLRKLLKSGEVCGGESYGFRLAGGDVEVVAIANWPFEFDGDSMGRMEAMEQLRLDYADDNAACPVMSGTCMIDSSGIADLAISPVMSRVVLREISNNMEGYVRLENPRAFLSQVNPSAEILRVGGFRPDSQSMDTLRVFLPCDIGLYTRYPATELFCYPNDSPEVTMGNPATVFNLECEIEGRTCVFSAELPPLKRNRTVYVDMSVDGPGACDFAFGE